MKQVVIIISIFFSNTFSSYSQDADSSFPKKVIISFCNNSSASKQFSFISYAPDEAGNATIQINLKPGEKFKQVYKAGTILYLADERQVDIVMSGIRLTGKPFRIISKKDDDTIINLVN